MKSKIFLLLLSSLFFIKKTTAQTPPAIIVPREDNIYPGAYFTDDNINKFIGTWQWVSGADTVTIVLKKYKRTYDFNPTFYQDVLHGCHTYIKNGQLVESSMQYINSADLDKYKLAGESDYQDSTKANLLFGDLGKRKSLDLTLQFKIGASPNQLVWHTDYRDICSNCLPGMTLPRDMILTRL
jgi:hypothetical protein